MSQIKFNSLPREAKIYVAGHQGLVGSAIVRELQRQGVSNILCRTHSELDLTNQQDVNDFFAKEKPEYVILAAAKVGGIQANNIYRGEFIYQNLMISSNVIHASYLNNVKRLIFLGSSCIYPKNSPQPIKEEYLLTSELEQTNQPYALAKIAGIEMCWSYNRQYGTQYVALMPTNLYGIGDNYHPTNSHVIPGLLRRAHLAKLNQDPTLTIWGTGNVWREFLLSDDLARACIHILSLPEDEYSQLLNEQHAPILNVGSGAEVTIKTLAQTICKVVGYQGKLVFDDSKPDGTYRKYLDSSKIKQLGWQPSVNLEEGLTVAYHDFQKIFDKEQNKNLKSSVTNQSHRENSLATKDLPIVNLILSGGVGSRLWPVSNSKLPKQFCEAICKPSLYNLTIQRLQTLSNNFVVVANSQHLELATKALENLSDISNFDFVLESIGRNTAPAVLTGLLEIVNKYGDALVLVSPADHLIKNFDNFVDKIAEIKDYIANNDVICTFGIEPDSPRVEYGYIAPSQAIENISLFKVDKFHEKPQQELAQEYLKLGYLWNSGIYFARASNFIKSFKVHQPLMYELAQQIYSHANVSTINTFKQIANISSHRVINLTDEYQNLNSISIDYAISEVANNMVTCPLNINWTDMGSWESILENSDSDLQQNIILGTVYSYDLHNSYIKTATRPILAVGVKDLVVIDTDDFTLISAKDQIKFAKDKFADFIKSQE